MIAEALSNVLSRGHVLGEDGDLEYVLGGNRTAAGERVSPQTAMKVASVYACVTIITQAVRAMPLNVVRDVGENVMRPNREHRLWDVLHTRPNPEMHAGQLWDWIVQCMLLRGNGYCYIDRERNGRVRYLRPIHPGRVEVGRHPVTRRKIFVVNAPDDREQVDFIGGTDDIVHFIGFQTDPLLGTSVISHLRETIGRALSEDRHAATTMKNQGRPSGILTTEGKLDDDRAKRLVARWEAAHGGSGKAGRTAVLENGSDWKAVTMTAADMELVKQRAISREDVAISFQIPGDMLLVGSEANLHYSSDASRDVRLVKYGVMPWAKRVQDALEISDMLPWGDSLPRFNPAGLLKADIKTRYEAHKVGIDAGFLTPNEARQVEDFEPIAGLDKTKPQIEPPPQQRNGNHPERIVNA